RLDESEQSLKSAVEREPASAVAWSELGVTQRMRGEFKDAAASYEHAIAADPQFAPAWRNLAVVSDLYLGDPGRGGPPPRAPGAAPPAAPGTTPGAMRPNAAAASPGAGV